MTTQQIADKTTQQISLQDIVTYVDNNKTKTNWKLWVPVIGSVLLLGVSWGVWVTTAVFSMQAIKQDMSSIKADFASIETKLDGIKEVVGHLPPTELRVLPNEVAALKARTTNLEEFERENREAHARIEIAQKDDSAKLTVAMETIKSVDNKIEIILNKLE